MPITAYQPWSLMNQLQGDINDLFARTVTGDSSGATADWVPETDIAEYADRYEIAVDLPGVDPKTVDITLSDGVLSVSGDRGRLRAVEEQKPTRHRSERRFGRFHRRFILPDTVDAEKVNAAGKDGVLSIRIPKTPEVQPRRIEVTTVS